MQKSGATDPGGADDLARAPTAPPPAGPRRPAGTVRKDGQAGRAAAAAAYAPTLPADRSTSAHGLDLRLSSGLPRCT